MKQHDITQCLMDIIAAIDNIEEYLTEFMGRQRDFNVYMQKKLLRSGVERQLEIIGEATNRIRQTDPAFRLENSRQIIALRNRVIHAYDNVNDILIWDIVVRHLPSLRKEADRLLG
jgi:uncharacterized protein with HEPN domain